MLSIDDVEGKQLICTKGFLVDRVDGDGFTLEEDAMVIEEGSKFDCEGPGYVCGEVRLEGDKFWLEVSIEKINECFKLVG